MLLSSLSSSVSSHSSDAFAVSVGLAAARATLVLLFALATMPLLRRASAALRRGVLVAAFGAVLALPVVSAALPALRIALPERATLSLPNDVQGAAEPVAGGALGPLQSVASSHDGAGRASTEVKAAANRALWRPSLGEVSLALWALGALFVVLRLVLGVARAERLVRGARIVATTRLGRRQVEVRVSNHIDTPAVAGLFRSAILLPRDALSWSDERRHVVLLHELAHVQRRDCLCNVLVQLACAVHWYNPVAWLLAKRLRIERELAADDLVLDRGTRASTYAEHLLAIATADTGASIPGGALGMAQPSQIEVRIAALLAWDRARTPLGRARLLALGFTAAALLMVVACATPSSYVASGAASPATALAAAPALASRAPASIAASPEGALATKREGMPADAIARAAAGERGGARAELTLDPALQEIAEDETDHLVAEWKTRAANVIVIDPATGAILAMTSRSPDATREVAVATEYVPGSTLKSLVVAAALEERTVEEHQRFFCENGQRAYGKRTLHDAAPHGWLETSEVLAVSSNVGAAKISETLGAARLDTWLKRFHLGQRPPVQIASAASGAIPAPSDDAFASAVLSIGEGLTATPLQIASGYAALANDGIYNAPTLVRRVFDGDGRVVWEHRPTAERLLRADTAHAVMTMLERVVTSDKGTGRAAHVEGHRVAGKTGTADLPRPAGAPAPKEGEEEYYASFVGAVPADHPRYVILVGAEASRAHGYGGTVAAPVFARIATRALAR